jgi:PLP dependent protein
VQSVDGVDLLNKLDAAAGEAGRTLEVLIQVDLAGEATKFGVTPEAAMPIFQAGRACKAARIVGLMTLPPVPESPEDARPWFKRLREVRNAWAAAGVPPDMLGELSMGMSGDFEVAVEEGATIVRVGTAVFGAR